MTEPQTPTAPACEFPGHPGPAGHINACQLCPISPTYWRGQEAQASIAATPMRGCTSSISPAGKS